MTQILLDASSPYVRLVLRIYFNITFVLLGFIGDQCCRKRSQLQLMHKNTINATDTTGWLRGLSAAYVIYSVRRSPAGVLGVFMILTGLMWVAADFVVSATVVSVDVVDRCPFDTTGHYFVLRNDTSDYGPYAPAPIGALWDTITRATFTSQSNGGLTGIFGKANEDLKFRADAQDIQGRWTCGRGGDDVQYAASEDPTLIIEDLTSRNFLFGNSTHCQANWIGNNLYFNFVVLSTSVGDWSQALLSGKTADEIISSPLDFPWDVRAAVDMSSSPSVPKIMRPYLCKLDAPANLQYILGKIQALTTLQDLCSNAAADIYQYSSGQGPLVADPGVPLASLLDGVVMMGAAYQAGYNVPAPNITDPSQGCLATRTKIPAGTIFTFVIVTLCTLGLIAYLGVLWVLLRQSQRQETVRYKLVATNTPNGLLDWMQQAVISTTESERQLTHSSLKNWNLTPSYDYRHLYLKPGGEELENRPMLLNTMAQQSVGDGKSGNSVAISPAHSGVGVTPGYELKDTPGAR